MRSFICLIESSDEALVDLSGTILNHLYEQLRHFYDELSGFNVARELILP